MGAHLPQYSSDVESSNSDDDVEGDEGGAETPRDVLRDAQRDAVRDMARDRERDYYRDAHRDTKRDYNRDKVRDGERDRAWYGWDDETAAAAAVEGWEWEGADEFRWIYASFYQSNWCVGGSHLPPPPSPSPSPSWEGGREGGK
jgi:hypothetical protein